MLKRDPKQFRLTGSNQFEFDEKEYSPIKISASNIYAKRNQQPGVAMRSSHLSAFDRSSAHPSTSLFENSFAQVGPSMRKDMSSVLSKGQSGNLSEH